MSAKRQKPEWSLYWWPEARELIFLKEEATPEYWHRQWRAEDWKTEITWSRTSRYWSRLLKRYLPDNNSRILEGGCGNGHLVDAMNYWGHRSIGVDFAEETVDMINEAMPASTHLLCPEE